jgi:hypothetical protein
MPTAATTSSLPSSPTQDDRDTLHTVRLADLPLEHPALRRARVIKNAQFNSVVEVFNDKDTGSGQIAIGKIPEQFNIPWNHADMDILHVLGDMPSYDVYSLRVVLRKAGIAVNNQAALSLSPAKVAELSGFMTNFVRPLFGQIYGDAARNVETFAEVHQLFRDPDIRKARERLALLADKLCIEMADVPRFLEDYADIFLAISYYRQCLDRVIPVITEFFVALDDLRKNFTLRANQQFQAIAKDVQDTFSHLLRSVKNRFDIFTRLTDDMWSDLSARQFYRIERAVKAFHQVLGGVLCGLTVKMDAWVARFPDRNIGSPARRSDFIISDIRPGMKRITEIAAGGYAAVP